MDWVHVHCGVAVVTVVVVVWEVVSVVVVVWDVVTVVVVVWDVVTVEATLAAATRTVAIICQPFSPGAYRHFTVRMYAQPRLNKLTSSPLS